ncbi:MAG: glycosyltransferase [Planctomycetaceae bacterium]
MHVLVNLVHLDPPANGGASRIAREVSRLLADHARAGRAGVTFAVGSAFAAQFAAWIDYPEAEVVPCLADGEVSPWLRSLPVDLIVSPLFGAEPFHPGDWPGKVQHLASMPDAQALDMPELFSADESRQRRKTYASLKQASKVVTISEHARQQLIYHLGLTPQQVVVAPLGTDIGRLEADGRSLVDGPYVYYPANDWPHKRHEFLMQVMEHIWRDRPEVKLVLSGGHRSGFATDLIKRHPVASGRIIDVGFVSESQIVNLYRNAEALLFASRYEGFGMPLVEAMACRCPVICSPVTAIPEVAGDAALYINSDDPARWADAFLRTLPAIRDQYIERGVARAAEFSWLRLRQTWEELLGSVYDATPPRTSSGEPTLRLSELQAELLSWSQSVRHLQAAADDRQRLIVTLQRTAAERMDIIQQQEAALNDCQLRLDALRAQQVDRSQTINLLQEMANERLDAIHQLSNAAEERLTAMTELSRAADERLDTIDSLRQTADERLQTISTLSLTADERLAVIDELQRAADERLEVIHSLQASADAFQQAANERLDIIHRLHQPEPPAPPALPSKRKLRLFRREKHTT